MGTPLRKLTVLVDEPREGAYHWLLIEATGEYIEAWIQVSESDELYETYHQAMAAGLLALQAQIEDLDLGPREAALEPVRAAKHGGLFGAGFGAAVGR